ncbi:MAG TPA: TlpA disulfide reductase family protein [Pyrinomonadaceae bacterium]|nr:TlpA disulfide reductase family protein [Pyrinomonadaceae bacterium]
MRKTFPLLLLLTVFATPVGAQSGRRLRNPPPPPPPAPAPESLTSSPKPVSREPLTRLPEGILTRNFEAIDKGSFRLADFSGKVMVVNLWATWCGPCRREVPDYEKVRKEYAGRDVEFIGLTTEDPVTTRNRVQKFVRDFNFKFRIGWVDRETAHILMNGRNVIPQTLVISAEGRVISHWSGYNAQNGDRLRAAIESALSELSTSAERQ